MLNSLAALANAPDFAVLTDDQVCTVLNISADTLSRLDKQGDSPERVKLSPNRKGRTVGAIRKWLQQHAEPRQPEAA